MKKLISKVAVVSLLASANASAQSIHFSQMYNAPLLVNPANTALLPEHDWRVGMNYRNQWASVPVPYGTFSAYADFQTLKSEDKYNNLGIGISLFTDRAGDGLLSLTNPNLSLAYHLQIGQNSILSFGASAGYVQRSLNYDKLTYDFQWDGSTFNANNPNGEKTGVIKTNYANVHAGLNYVYFSDIMFFKLSVGANNINQPKETFYAGSNNEVGMRPTANIDVNAKLSNNLIINPSVYYATQKGAMELMYGTLLRFNVQPGAERPTQVIFGGYHRLADAVVGVMGLKWNDLQLMANYDHTISKLGPYNSGKGALEFSIVYTGLYPSNAGNRSVLGCPRF